MNTIDSTLKERGDRYGDFTHHARIAQELQNTMRIAGERISGEYWDKLSDVQRQALTVIADKIARILSGDPNYADNWHDIQGYAKLAEERLLPPPVEPRNSQSEMSSVDYHRMLVLQQKAVEREFGNTAPSCTKLFELK